MAPGLRKRNKSHPGNHDRPDQDEGQHDENSQGTESGTGTGQLLFTYSDDIPGVKAVFRETD